MTQRQGSARSHAREVLAANLAAAQERGDAPLTLPLEPEEAPIRRCIDEHHCATVISLIRKVRAMQRWQCSAKRQVKAKPLRARAKPRTARESAAIWKAFTSLGEKQA